MYLIADAIVADHDAARREADTWRRVRRFDAPAALAVAAALDVARAAADPAGAVLVALAPCQAGSPALHRWVTALAAAGPDAPPLRVNPTHTLHAVDNLALSAVAIALGSTGEGVGLGGAAGQGWAALDVAREHLARGAREALVVAGDQDASDTGAHPRGVALLLAAQPAPHRRHGRTIRLEAIERQPGQETSSAVVPHAAAGLIRLLATLAELAPGAHRYQVPARDGDGIDELAIDLVVDAEAAR